MAVIGFVGLGKLGLPVALAMESRGHTLLGTDIDPQVARTLATRTLPYVEAGADALLATTRLALLPLEDVARRADIIFVAVQTPHDPRYEGVTPLPREPRDFNYTYLEAALLELDTLLTKARKPTPVAVISTVLPGTMARLRQWLSGNFRLVYNPFFIAMGTTVRDFLAPEFVLLGVDDEDAANTVSAFYGTIHDRPIARMSVAEAELTKVAYNTFISQKIVFANTLMEICHKTQCNVDTVTGALALATQRLMSPAYLRGGMGDGGGCHPRDNIALSWLAHELALSCDPFEQVMENRESQTEWLADLIQEHDRKGFPIVLLGRAFKPNTRLEVGSPARLLSRILDGRDMPHEHVEPGEPVIAKAPRCLFVATAHAAWRHFPFQPGDLVLDPWRYLRTEVEAAGATYVGIGDGR